MKETQTFSSLGSKMFNLKNQEDYLCNNVILLCLLLFLPLQ